MIKKIFWIVLVLILTTLIGIGIGVGIYLLTSQPTSPFSQKQSYPKELFQILPEYFTVSGKLKVITDNSVIIEDITGKEGEYRLAEWSKISRIDRGPPDSLKEIRKEDLKEGQAVQLTVKRQEDSYYVRRIIAEE